jgi:two-component system, NarL family, sensor histidine kinase DesK
MSFLDRYVYGTEPPARQSRLPRWGQRPPFWMALWAAVWLVYMVSPVKAAWQHPEAWRRVAGIALAVLFSAVYIYGFLRVRAEMRRTGQRLRLGPNLTILGVMGALCGLLCLTVGQAAVGSLVYLGVMSVFLLPLRGATGTVLGLAGVSLLAPRVVPGWKLDDQLAFQIAISSLAVWGVVHLVERNAQLAAAREEIARLAVANERNRFARDLHDLLGHSLTVVSVKAELAARLVQLAPERAEAEIGDIQRLAREALADVRSAVGGYRDVSLGAELARAHSALVAAGIEPELPSSPDVVPAGRQELFGWVVREGVTNVVRHSEAKRCWVRLSAQSIEIVDDGRGPGDPGPDPGPAGAGSGLRGLRERVSAAGGTVSVGRPPDGGFTLRVSMP